MEVMLQMSRRSLSESVGMAAVAVAVFVFGCDGTSDDLLTTEPGVGLAGNAGMGVAGSHGAGGTGEPRWSPAAGLEFQVQLTGPLDLGLDVDAYVVDFETTDEAEIASMQSAGFDVVCYFSATTHEPWRADADDFPSEVLGSSVDDYPDERWLDVRSDTVRTLMLSRIVRAADKGCQGIDPASLGSHPTDSGFSISEADHLEYARLLAEAAHLQNLAVVYSGSSALVAEVGDLFDWGLSHGCLSADTCAPWSTWRQDGATVWVVEIGDETDAGELCPQAAQAGFDLTIKSSDFGAFRVGCP